MEWSGRRWGEQEWNGERIFQKTLEREWSMEWEAMEWEQS